ncbi:hypothetical protein HMPREF1991_01721 [Hoylesella loescheii DSM 19665 = JCM 12249 = ATCC 15930]|uniref:Uncharacterized protein n=1 Tax=Hoylesella loescheii DSM 19665 = JCM 12249 = ATCC 15930 TaxID=1122985 RepID=A0A069QHN7_HOYLO|nr:hypothetical protein HMPREF1991_01721 [Hoylesella loescheii DSM 19665 = JCM 12249 = ATCC 15930]
MITAQEHQFANVFVRRLAGAKTTYAMTKIIVGAAFARWRIKE